MEQDALQWHAQAEVTSEQSSLYAGVISGNFAAFFSSMTKHDGHFHLLMTAALLGGFLFMSTAGESFWRNANKGVSISLPHAAASGLLQQLLPG